MTAAPTINQLLRGLAERAPWEKAGSWDPVGLQLGDPAVAVRRSAICHEVTEAVVSELEEDPVDLLVSYHALLFKPTTSLVAGRSPGGRALRLIRAGVALAVVHTNFDVASGGTAEALADALGLEEVRGFAPLYGPDTVKVVTFLPVDAADPVLDAVVAAGAGRVGNYTHCSYRVEGVGTFFAGAGTSPVAGVGGKLNREPEVRIEFVAPRAREAAVLQALVAAHPYEEPAFDVYDRRGDTGMIGRVGRIPPGSTLAEFGERVAEALDGPPLRVAGDLSRPIERVAVVPGSGGEFLGAAVEVGADALVTGDLTHHGAREALDRGLCLVDAGHLATERPGLQRLFAILAALGPECRSLLEPDPDPWRRVTLPGS
jgi:dinuclear metal center YbgI/SA1388 family protein